MTLVPQLAVTCGRCGKRREGIRHVCVSKPKPGPGRRKDKVPASGRQRSQQDRHDYQACSDRNCPRPLCVAYKTGHRTGYQEGNEDGYNAGFASGFTDGVRSCPLPHQ